jgi:hypothetical protein
MIATPRGDRRIGELGPSDTVYSVDRNATVAVPILRLSRARAVHHSMVRVTLQDGSVLSMSPRHPTSDGRVFGDLIAGGLLDGRRIVSVEKVLYEHPFTYDLLPASDSGMYFASGVLIGSTLHDAIN